MLNIKVVSWALATTTLTSFVGCVLFGLFTPDSLHSRALLEQLLPGFKWLTLQGVLFGAIESFLYSAYAGLVYVPAYNFFLRRFDHGPADSGAYRPASR